ncbi:zinc finger protein 782-like [Topomyia yanbarensis]|uniref:zinc finger protein 782-like n=1 Tax=Topomyia yanbarensis TaxID=2498891 RepID=UPI00273B79CB|nr:zinc finger protein 782-like [Topomyia yanbarensis]
MDFEKICRLCCASNCRLQSIYTTFGIYSIKQLFEDILRLEISADDGLPQTLCETCLSSLTKMFETIKTFRDNDRMLRLQLCGVAGLAQINIKEEVLSEEREQTPTHELQDDIIDAKNILVKQDGSDDQQSDDLKSDPENFDKEWFQSDTENSDMLEEEKSTKKRSRKKQTKKGKVGSSKMSKGRKRRRPKAQLEEPNRPRLNDFRCYICKSDSLGTPEALLAHLNSHMNELPYTCTDCVLETVVINKVSTLNIHKRMHENPHKCPHCDKRYSNKGAVDTHVQTHHSGDNAPCPSPCEQCGKICSSKASLKHHLKWHSNTSTCEFCGKMFPEKHKLRRHIERKHEKIKKYECHLCQKKLCSLDSVQVHIRTMHSTKEVKCEYCHKSYPSEISLRYHLKKHEQNPNVKFSCGWKNYYTFVETEEDTKPENRMKKCNLCGVVVKSIGPHMHAVHFPQEFRCNLCEAVFKRKAAYDIHILEHEHGKAHRCPICGKEFSERKNLIAHLRTKKHRDHPMAKSLNLLGIQGEPGAGYQAGSEEELM